VARLVQRFLPRTLFFGRDLVFFELSMSSSSSPRSFTPVRPRQPDSLDDVLVTSLLLTSDGRRPFRTRPLRRLVTLLFAAAVATLVLFSQRPLLSEYSQPELVPRPLTTEKGSALPTATSVMQTEVVERPVEPVIFALLMYSETSAKEGAILLKVTSLTQIDIETIITHLV
jgi:hypothetical protein